MALALTGRRRVWAAAVSALAAVALAVAVVGRGCAVETPGPEHAVRHMITAANAGDARAVYALLTPATQSRLEEGAQRATDLVGSNIRYTALDLISIGNPDEAPAPIEIRLLRQKGDRAVVEVVSGGVPSELDVIRIDGRWRIDLPDYPAAP